MAWITGCDQLRVDNEDEPCGWSVRLRFTARGSWEQIDSTRKKNPRRLSLVFSP